ncbi:MAG: hypothetical protein JWO91_3044 [Acidobacteriaceae bacterium]|nr:hypothetical protein [Acidobacteriaceae bacterium]
MPLGIEVGDGTDSAGRSVVELGGTDGGDADDHQRYADFRRGGDAGDESGFGIRSVAGQRE